MGIFDKFSRKKGQGGVPTKSVAAASYTAEKKREKRSRTRGPLAREGAGDAYRILLRPVITEKSARLETHSTYTFLVHPDSNKTEVAKAVRDLYGVKPEAVRMLRVEGKHVRFGRFNGKEKNVKKALVTLKPGETLTLFETA